MPPQIQQVAVKYSRAALPAAPITVPEILVLVRSLQELVRAARPLEASDFIGPASLAPSQDLDLSGPAARLPKAFAGLSNLNASLAALLNSISSGGTPTAANGDSLASLLLTAAGYGFPAAAPMTTARDPTSLSSLLEQATAIAAKVAQRVTDVLNDPGIASSGQLLIAGPNPTLKIAQDTAQAIFGAAFVVLPVIMPGSAANDPVAQAASDLTTGIAAWQAAGASGGHVTAAGLLQQFTHLRPPIVRLDEFISLSAALTGAPVADLAVALLGGSVPYSAANPWLGQGPVATQFPWTVNVSGTPESLRGSYALLVWTPPALGAATGASMCGLFFDEWIEQIPNNIEKTAVAFHYAEPTARAPQSFLLAMLPDTARNWSASALYEIVLEAVSLAKIRTVDPQTLELGGKVGQLLPALFQAFRDATISSFVPGMPTSTDGVGS